jgi:hypothetical protein
MPRLIQDKIDKPSAAGNSQAALCICEGCFLVLGALDV